MISELLESAGIEPQQEDAPGKLLLLIDHCGRGDFPWSSLAPLLASIETNTGTIEGPVCYTAGRSSPYWRSYKATVRRRAFSCRLRRDKSRLLVVGMDEQLVIQLDPTRCQVLACWTKGHLAPEGGLTTMLF